MTVGAQERITVRIGRKEAETALTNKLKGRGAPQIEEVKVGTFMSAQLYGDDFEISSRSDKGQVIPDNGFAEWTFDVIALEAGKKSLTLQVSVRYKIGGGEETTNLPVLTKDIAVQVNHWWKAKRFMSSNWQWFAGVFGTLFSGIGGFLSKRWFDRRDEKKKSSEPE